MSKYKELKNAIKQKIVTGEYAVGQFIPSESELSEEYGLNRHTIRHALDLLVNEGYISKQKGKGSRVEKQKSSLGLLSFIGFTKALRTANIQVTTSILEGPVKISWPKDFFISLSSEDRLETCFFLKRLRFANHDPIMLEETYLPVKHLNNFDNQEFENGSLFETLLKRYSIDIIDLKQEIRAIMPTLQLLDTLNIKKSDPLLHIRRVYITSRPNFKIYSELYVNTTNYFINNGV